KTAKLRAQGGIARLTGMNLYGRLAPAFGFLLPPDAFRPCAAEQTQRHHDALHALHTQRTNPTRSELMSKSLLKTINSPADLKRMAPEQFPQLCQEIREQIISVVSNVGGHLASNLGVVELTVALHSLLDTPHDKIVWDTGNQGYAHKLLTGRREQFHTLRQYGGQSGFCKRE